MDKVIRKMSYTAASSFPFKTLIHPDVAKSIREKGIIPPTHIQINPTNLCNLDCEFCSCAGRKKNEVLPIGKAEKMIEIFTKLGTKAVTITGGGEPLLYPYINRLLDTFDLYGIEIGLVTNGTQFKYLDSTVRNKITWCRISHADTRKFNGIYWSYLDSVIKSAPDVDWAFSIVVSGEYDKELLHNVSMAVSFANQHDFTHVRIVPDLFNTKEIDLDIYRDYLPCNVNDDLVEYQERNNATHGVDCYICYLKPYIDTNGLIYTCCGAQYALPGNYRSMPDELCLGTIDDFIEKQKSCKPFDGSICETCYYTNYNEVLPAILKIRHGNFV